TSGADALVLTPTYGTLNNAEVFAFSNVQTVSAFGAADDAVYLFDSDGSDLFVGTPTFSYLQASTSLNIVSGFGQVRGTSSAGGSDLALLFDSAGNDVFVGTPTFSYLA